MKRILAVFIAFLQLGWGGSSAFADATLWADRHPSPQAFQAPELLPPLLSPQAARRTDIPLKNGVIRETYKSPAPSSRTLQKVILIQDVHLNNEAQRNIAAILQNLIDRHAADVVAVEGAFEKYNFEPFRSFHDKGINQDVAEYFLGANQIGAPSYVGMTSETEPPPFVGVDDQTAYEANVEAYLDSLDLKDEAAARLNEAGRILAQAREKTFSAPLKVFDQAVEDYDNGRLDAYGFIREGRKYGWRSRQIDSFLKACRFEKILNMAKVARERSAVLKQLSDACSAGDKASLIETAARYQRGEIRYAEMYASLENLLKQKGISLKTAPSFRDYLDYVQESDSIDGEKLVRDIENFKQRTIARLARTNEERRLSVELAWYRLAKKLVVFSLTPAEWDAYKALRQRSWTAVLDPFERFYFNAEIRSQKMVDHLLAQNAKTAVLVTGGFHAPAVRALLKERGLSYTLVAPKMMSVDQGDGTGYLSVFTQEKSPIETVFKGEKLFLAPAAVQLGTPAGPNTTVEVTEDAIDAVFASGHDITIERRGTKVSFGRTPQRGKPVFSRVVHPTNRAPSQVYGGQQTTVRGRVEKWFGRVHSRGTKRQHKSGRQSRFEQLSQRLHLSATSWSPDIPDYSSNAAAVSSLSPGAAQREQEFSVSLGNQATTLKVEAPKETDLTTMGAQYAPSVLAPQNGVPRVFEIDIAPFIAFNFDPADNGYTETIVDLSPYGFQTVVTPGPNDYVQVSLIALPDGMVEPSEVALLVPSEKAAPDAPAPQTLWKTGFINAANLETTPDGTKKLFIEVPEDEWAAMKGSVVLSVKSFQEVDGEFVPKPLPNTTDAGSQNLSLVENPDGTNTPNGLPFEKVEAPPSPDIPNFFIPSGTQFFTSAPRSRAGGGPGFEGGGVQGVEPKTNPRPGPPQPHLGAVNHEHQAVGFSTDRYDLLYPIFDELQTVLSSDSGVVAPEGSDEAVLVHFNEIDGEGNFVSIEIKVKEKTETEDGTETPAEVKDPQGEVIYWVAIVEDDKIVEYAGPFVAKPGETFAVPPEFQNDDVAIVVRNKSKGPNEETVVYLKRNTVPATTPRVLKRAAAPAVKTAAPSPQKFAASRGVLLPMVAVAAARPEFKERWKKFVAFLLSLFVVQQSQAPVPLVPPAIKPQPAPKEVIPFEPLLGVLKFGKALKAEPREIMGERQWVYVPKSKTKTELFREINGRLSTIYAINGIGHNEIFLTAANAQFASELREHYKSNRNLTIRVPDDYDSVTKMRELFDGNKRFIGNIKFLIRKGAEVDQNFLNTISLLSKEEGFNNDRISVFLILESTLRGDTRPLSLDRLLDPRLYDYLHSQA